MHLHTRSITFDDNAAVILLFTCAAAFGILSLVLLLRYLHNSLRRKLPISKPSMLLLAGFVVYSGCRSGTLMFSAIHRELKDALLVLPTALYVVLLASMVRLWTLYITTLLNSSRLAPYRHHQQQDVVVTPIHRIQSLSSPLNASSVVTQDERAALDDQGRGVSNPARGLGCLQIAVVIFAIACALIIGCSGVLCSCVSSLEHSSCVDVPTVADITGCVACGAYLIFLATRMYAVRSTELTTTLSVQGQAPVSKSLFCCPLLLLSSTVHGRAVTAAAVFGAYTVVRGSTITLNLIGEHSAGLDNRHEQYLLPSFYFIEWFFLCGCVRLIIGPPSLPNHRPVPAGASAVVVVGAVPRRGIFIDGEDCDDLSVPSPTYGSK